MSASGPHVRACPGAALRVLVVTSRFAPQVGGTERYLTELLPALARAGCEVQVLAQRMELVAELRSAGVSSPVGSVYGEPVVARVARWGFAKALADRIRHGAPERSIDLVHVHGYSRPLMAQTVLAARALGTPVVWSLHGGLMHPPFGHRRTTRLLMRAFDRWALGPLLCSVAAFIVLADSQVEELAARGVPSERVHLLPNMVSEDVLAFEGRPEYSGRLIAVGRLAPEKRLHDLVDAVALDPSLPDVDIVGPDDGAGDDLRRRAHGLVPGRVRFLGVPDRAVLVRAIAASRALVMPSAWEGQPMAALEALALGVPVVASDEAARALPAEGVSRVPVGDIGALVGALRRVVASPVDSHRDAPAGGRHDKAMTADRHAEAVRRVYRGALATAAGDPPVPSGARSECL